MWRFLYFALFDYRTGTYLMFSFNYVDNARQPAIGWNLGKVVVVLPRGGYFLIQAEAGPSTQKVFLGRDCLPKSMPELQVPPPPPRAKKTFSPSRDTPIFTFGASLLLNFCLSVIYFSLLLQFSFCLSSVFFNIFPFFSLSFSYLVP
jgi:hypothetical protein